jgi:UDP-glucuronate 4-epimerase
MLAGQPIEVYNNGDLRRDFTYIDDIIDGFVRAVYRPLGYRILNLGNGSPVELLQFINVLEAAFEVTATKRWLPMQQGDVYETYADISAARTELGYQPSTSLVEGVKAFADWYRSYRLTSAATMDV